MDNLNLIQQILDHVAAGQKNAYTEPLLELAREAVKEPTARSEQQAQLVVLIKELETLPGQVTPHFLGSSARSL